MDQNIFIYTVPQWIIFAAIASLGYGWVEKKKAFTYVGLGILIGLGLYALYAILEGYFIYRNYLTPEEILSEDMGEDIVEQIPAEARMLPAYWLFIATGIMTIPALYFEWKNKKAARYLMIIACLIALSGFFIIVGALKN